MKQLVELEKKVNQIVSKNRELVQVNHALKEEVEHFQVKNAQLEAQLLSQCNNTTDLSKEKDSIEHSINDLLTSINTLEETAGKTE